MPFTRAVQIVLRWTGVKSSGVQATCVKAQKMIQNASDLYRIFDTPYQLSLLFQGSAASIAFFVRVCLTALLTTLLIVLVPAMFCALQRAASPFTPYP